MLLFTPNKEFRVQFENIWLFSVSVFFSCAQIKCRIVDYHFADETETCECKQ